MIDKKRCQWVTSDLLDIEYHDKEWGVPVHNDLKLFEMLILESAQAGLSWKTILKKRENYRKAFDSFDPKKIAKYSYLKINKLLSDSGIVRNRLKISSTVQNAKAFLIVQKEFGSFNIYVWQFVGGKPIKNKLKSIYEYPTKTKEAETLSRDLVKRGFRFIGPTICYAFMEAVGMVNDHQMQCFRYHDL